jgi:hypothetical protein
MPLTLNYKTPNTGAAAAYHVVQTVTLDAMTTRTTATIGSYCSKDDRDAGRFPMYTQQIALDGLPADGQTAFAYAEAQLIVPAPASGPAPVQINRYAFSGAVITP